MGRSSCLVILLLLLLVLLGGGEGGAITLCVCGGGGVSGRVGNFPSMHRPHREQYHIMSVVDKNYFDTGFESAHHLYL